MLKLPALVGYLVTGLALGPHALGVASNAQETQHLAEFGVVFLMFSIGLEFSLGKLHAMRRIVFGLGGAQVAATLALALAVTAALALGWRALVARVRSNELFVLNVLLIILLAAFVTRMAGLSLVLGAFLAGMLIAETEYRFQVEEDIKPYRDVLLGLFFITVGMLLDLRLVAAQLALVAGLFIALVGGKLALIALLARLFGNSGGTALRVALALANGGEFGFVLLPLAGAAGLVGEELLQALL